MKKKVRLKDLKTDDKNFNKHSEFGMQLLEKSLRKFGGARSIVIDKNNRVIAGNATVEAAADIGLDEVEVVESDGKKIIAVKRTDINLNTKKGRELALADNAIAVKNIVLDAEIIEAELSQSIAGEWGVISNTDLINLDELSDDFNLPSGDKSNLEQITFTLTKEQADIIKESLAEVKKNRLHEEYEMYNSKNDNSNGNAIFSIVMQWKGMKS